MLVFHLPKTMVQSFLRSVRLGITQFYGTSISNRTARFLVESLNRVVLMTLARINTILLRAVLSLSRHLSTIPHDATTCIIYPRQFLEFLPRNILFSCLFLLITTGLVFLLPIFPPYKRRRHPQPFMIHLSYPRLPHSNHPLDRAQCFGCLNLNLATPSTFKAACTHPCFLWNTC